MSENLSRLQIDLTEDAMKKIDDMRMRLKLDSRIEVIKRSLRLYYFILKEYSDKDMKLVLKDSKGNESEIVLLNNKGQSDCS